MEAALARQAEIIQQKYEAEQLVHKKREEERLKREAELAE